MMDLLFFCAGFRLVYPIWRSPLWCTVSWLDYTMALALVNIVIIYLLTYTKGLAIIIL